MRVLRTLMFPLCLPCGAGFLFALLWSWQGVRVAHLAALSQPLLYTLATLGLFLGWRFRRSSVVFGIALVLLARELVRFWGAGAEPAWIGGLGTLLVLNLLWLALIPDRGLFGRGALGRLLLLGGQGVAAVWAWHRFPDNLGRWVRFQALPPSWGVDDHLPSVVVVAGAGALLALLLFYLWRRSAPIAGFFWATAAVLVALAQPSGADSTPWFAAACLGLSLGLLEAFHFLAFRDELTSLPARRALNEDLASLGGVYTLAMVDIDHFKKVNDRHGHDVGDQVLRMVAARLAGVGGGGRAYRYGGEEFTLVFPGKTVADALPYLEDLREEIAAAAFTVRGLLRRKQNRGKAPVRAAKKTLRVTISIGAAAPGGGDRAPEQVVKAADKALYRAKRRGRNQVRH